MSSLSGEFRMACPIWYTMFPMGISREGTGMGAGGGGTAGEVGGAACAELAEGGWRTSAAITVDEVEGVGSEGATPNPAPEDVGGSFNH